MAAKNNDPAFLFYSKDFYEGTRMMLPEERACYIDLMIYQHQHGCIPLDLKRVLLYCNGINEATLKATLKAKFEATLEGYVNLKLESVMLERSEFSNKQSINGTVGQFFKKAKALLSKKDYITLKELLSDNTNNQIFELIIGKEIDKAMLDAMLIALLKHLEDANANENKDVIKDTWRESFEIYLSELNQVYNSLIIDKKYIQQREKFSTNVDIVLSLEKAYTDFWGVEKGWVFKKNSKSINLDWKATLTKAIDLNKVYKPFKNGIPVPAIQNQSQFEERPEWKQK